MFGDDENDEETYSIYRFFTTGKQIIQTGLTLEEARKHCASIEASSLSCTSEEGIALTVKEGPWFDGYERD